MNNFLIALNAVIPFFCYMVFGAMIRKTRLVDEDFLRKLNNMVFKAFFPVMMFYNMYSKERGLIIDFKLVALGLGSLAVVMTVLLFFVPKMIKERKKAGVIIQAIYRSNFVLFAVPLMESIYGDKGVTIATMLVAIVVPIYNILAVIVLQYYGSDSLNIRWGKLFKDVLTNPLISGTIIGFIFYLLRIQLPICIEKPISQFASLTTPLALFVLGGTLKFKSMLNNMKYLIPSILVKLLLLPALIIMASMALHMGPIDRFLLFCMYGTPVAAASYAMAQNMGCDGDLAGEFVVLSTSISVFTIFMWVFIFGSFGMI